jgi:hypothetical protein
MIPGMARWQHTVVLEPVPRAWFDQAVGLCFDTLTEYLTGIGDPPAAETQYTLPDGFTKVHLDSWQRDGETSARWWTVDLEGAFIGTARLDSPGNPRNAEVTGDYRGAGLGTGWLTETSGTVRVDLPAWWTGTARRGVDPGIAGRFRQRFAHGGGTIAVAPAPGGRWQVTVRVTVHGRGLLRPVGAVAFLFARGRFKGHFVKAVTEFAQLWNKEVPRLRTMNQDELRELITTELTGATP